MPTVDVPATLVVALVLVSASVVAAVLVSASVVVAVVSALVVVVLIAVVEVVVAAETVTVAARFMMLESPHKATNDASVPLDGAVQEWPMVVTLYPMFA